VSYSESKNKVVQNAGRTNHGMTVTVTVTLICSWGMWMKVKPVEQTKLSKHYNKHWLNSTILTSIPQTSKN